MEENGRTEPSDVMVIIGIEEVRRIVCRAVGQGVRVVEMAGSCARGERRSEEGMWGVWREMIGKRED